MEKELNELLGEQSRQRDKAKVEISEKSIDVMLIDEDGYNEYGNIFYSAVEAFDFLKVNGCLE